ncbi:hypothetical protein [Alishewanella jeotgali]|uniref:Uncharacterized protein n=1 Tax=Alishewanella jeotgali KCTC 22429 TaxID=1129374 RepID=H3Z9K0_9ALTE|nr:hypothetical protein AJE_00005 [Alishewanella jeotgali KCTC 22429]
MGQNSKARRDKKKKLKKDATASSIRQLPSDPSRIESEIAKLFSPSLLTTPAEINTDIEKFCRRISNEKPIFIEITPELWSRQSCCDSNTEEYIKIHGGKVICGYKIWYHPPNYIEGERHAVWYNDGVFRDITFNSDGEKRILFIPDVPSKQQSLELNEHRIRWAKDSYTRELVKLVEKAERMRPVYKMSKEEAWESMLTYESWLEGHRMSTVREKPIGQY